MAVSKSNPKCPTGYFHCVQSGWCVHEDYVCDGSVQCPDQGEDEDFEVCKHTYPEAATIKCLEADRGQYNITILAIPCDGNVECKNGEDEVHCQMDDLWTLMGAITGYLVILILVVSVRFCHRNKSIDWDHSTDQQNEEEEEKLLEFQPDDPKMAEEFFNKIHQTPSMAGWTLYFQGQESREQFNKALYKFEYRDHAAANDETLCCLKVVKFALDYWCIFYRKISGRKKLPQK